MKKNPFYKKYTSDKKMQNKYANYQEKYRENPKESDKLSVDLIKEKIKNKKAFELLDIACSTGNFLKFLKLQIPDAKLTGVDLASNIIENCKNDEKLSGIKFFKADVTSLNLNKKFDIITANAVTCLLGKDDYLKSLRSIYNSLKNGGFFIGFEWINPFNFQDLVIKETNEWHPEGMTIHIRPKKMVEQIMKETGFNSIKFYKFNFPFDLPFQGFDKDVTSFTRKDQFNERMIFRGILNQPWYHFVAKKA